MADNVYVLETYADQPAVTDDGTGTDWIVISGTYLSQFGRWGAQIYMFYEAPFSSSGWFYTYGAGTTTQHVASFQGLIENAQGGGGNEEIHGGSGANLIYGDPLDVAGSTDALYGNAGQDQLFGAGGSDYLFGGQDNDLLFGDSDPFSQDQGNFAPGDDTLRGDGGNDTLYGGWGTNSLFGDDGYDTADYSGFFDDFGNTSYRIVALIQFGTVVVYARDMAGGGETVVASDSLTGIEVIRGTSGDDRMEAVHILAPGDPTGTELHGGAGRDTLWGGPGLDALYGGDGDDTLSDFSAPPPGGGGVDVMSGGTGSDYYTIFNATTRIVEGTDPGYDHVVTVVSYTLPINVEKLILGPGSPDALNGTGNAGDNAFEGNVLANDLNGLAGQDYALGFAGNDTLRGGAGNDQLYGGTEDDLLIGGSQSDLLEGEAGRDTLQGGSENDTLLGGSHGDVLHGGLGRDVLRGGSGADMFYFASVTEAAMGRGQRDQIDDFRSGQDQIDLHRMIKNQGFIGSTAFDGSGNAEVRYDAATGLLSGDTDGNGSIDYQIALGIGTVLVAGDLIL